SCAPCTAHGGSVATPGHGGEVTEMALPGLTAEASRESRGFHYRAAASGALNAGAGVVAPQRLDIAWPWWYRCPPGCVPSGIPWRPCVCWSTHVVAGPVPVVPGVPVERRGGLSVCGSPIAVGMPVTWHRRVAGQDCSCQAPSAWHKRLSSHAAQALLPLF